MKKVMFFLGFFSKVFMNNAIAQTISTGVISPLSYCAGSSINVPYTVTGAFNSGNIFTAILSGASGSFTSPDTVTIGDLPGTISGTIQCTIPAITTTNSTAYRIRVISSNPAITGSDNGSNIIITTSYGWSVLGGSGSLNCNNTITCTCTDPFGNIYAAGYINTSANQNVARWNGSSWNVLSGLNANNNISSICSDPAGNIYAAGYFTNPQGSNCVKQWNKATNTWSELGGPNSLQANEWIQTVCSDASGNIYAAGRFTNPSSGYEYVAKWNGTNWSELGGTNSLKANSIIYSVLSDAAGNIYAAGDFSYLSGNSRYVAIWNGTSWGELGDNSGFTNQAILCLCTDATGVNIYVAGGYGNSNGYNYVEEWNGAAWSVLGNPTAAGLMHNIYGLCSDPSGNIYVGGNDENSDGNHFVDLWNKTTNTWSELGGLNALAANQPILSLCSDANGNIYAAGNFQDYTNLRYVARFGYANIPSISTQPITPTTYCSGATLNVSFTINGSYSTICTGNTFIAQLSDGNGNFTPLTTTINTPLISTSSGTIPCTIPPNTIAGTGYRIRVVSSFPVVIGSDNGSNITINNMPSTPSASSNSPICTGSTLNLTSTVSPCYSWSGPNSFSSSQQNPSITNAPPASSGTYTVTVTNANGCTASASTVVIFYTCTALNLKTFIQGYYRNIGTTTPMDNFGSGGCLFASGVSSNKAEVDTITISLEDPNTQSMVGSSVKGILHTDGSVWESGSNNVFFPASITGNSYYIKLNHRNAIETWSANPVLFASNTNYDFSTGIGQAYGDNMVKVDRIRGQDIYALWNGDVFNTNNGMKYSQDGVIESADYSLVEEDYTSVLFGYYPTDVTGDGVVESFDYSLIEENYTIVVFKVIPW